MNKEIENLSRNDEKLREILGSLDKVDAPKDFNFQLKSKIANVKPTRGNQAFWRYFVIGLPSLACLLLIAFFAFNLNTTPPNDTIADVKDQQKIQSPIIEEIKPPENSNVQLDVKPLDQIQPPKKTLPEVALKVSENKVLTKFETPQNARVENKKSAPNGQNVKDESSTDIAVKDISPPIQPKGLNATPIANTQINQTDTVFEIESVLKDLGVETAEENGKLKVKNVKKHSLAERSGIKNDDVIDAVNNKKITPKETSKKAFDAKSISVVREGKTLELKLQQ